MSRRLASIVALGCLCGAATAMSLPLHAQDVQSAALTNSLYTKHSSHAVHTEIVRVSVDQKFDAGEHQKILNAVIVWNYVLNGFIRIDVDRINFGAPETNAHAAAKQMTDWIIVYAENEKSKPGAITEELASTERMPNGGGLVLVSVGLLKRFSLENVILHELGHVLGLEHNPRSRLMSTDYVLDEQGCVDKVTVETLAKLKRLPVEELNWCVLPARN